MKSANVMEYEKDVNMSARDDGFMGSITAFKQGANWGSTESTVIKRLESALKSSCGCTEYAAGPNMMTMITCNNCEALAYLNEIRESVK